jgi:hypothetical protein
LKLVGEKKPANHPERTLEVICSNCKAKFIAYYGHDEENVEAVEVRKCALCGGDEYKRDNFKGATIRLVAQVTARR